MMKKAKLVAHHDDPPCTARLTYGRCNRCNLIPDMQSICLYAYCPKCDCSLTKMRCPGCKQTFKSHETLPPTLPPTFTVGEMLNLLTDAAKIFHKETLVLVKRNRHMNDLSEKDFARLKRRKKLTQRLIEALLVQFINEIGARQNVDYGLYAKDLKEN